MAKHSLRVAYGETLIELGKMDADFVVLDADLSSSTQTALFQKQFPLRHVNMGIAESNMCLFAAGLSKVYKVVFASSFAMFLTGRAWEEVRNSIAYDKANVKLVATHAGISVGEDGSSHQANEDIALMRLIPTMQVFVPADYYETIQILKYAYSHEGPMYIRLTREIVEDVFTESYQFKPFEPVAIKENGKARFVIFTTGMTTGLVKQAFSLLEEEKEFFAHFHLPHLKPFNKESLLALTKEAQAIFTFEEHSVIGGLADTILSALNPLQNKPLYKHGVDDVFGKSGKCCDLLDYFNLSAEKIAQQLKNYKKDLI
jgi:transketolase